MSNVDDQHVRPLYQALQNLPWIRRFQVQSQSTLVAIAQMPGISFLAHWKYPWTLFHIPHDLPLGGSTLITSAPKSDKITAAPGPATKLERSTTFSPEKMLLVIIVFLVPRPNQITFHSFKVCRTSLKKRLCVFLPSRLSLQYKSQTTEFIQYSDSKPNEECTLNPIC